MKILLIDDNIDDMVHFCDELRLEDHEVIQAANYDGLQQIVKKYQNFDFIILDLMMPPGENIPILESDLGYKSGQYLYDTIIEKHYPNCPFIIFTAMDAKTSIFKSVIKHFEGNKNYKGFLPKPSEIEQFFLLLKK